MIKALNLHKTYGLVNALDNVSFEIGRGEIVGFLGPNGAGKSTTMKILTGYIAPTSGEAWIANRSVGEPDESFRHALGYLPERLTLYPEMTVRGLLEFVARLRRVKKSAAKSSIEYAIERCGLESVVRRPIGHLSKGFRQRIGFAQAVVHQPEVLILDEPTNGLDPNQVEDIRSLVIDYGRDKTVLFSSHILKEVSAVANRVIVINRGQIVADDTPDTLISRMSGSTFHLHIANAEKDKLVAFLDELDCIADWQFGSPESAPDEHRLLVSLRQASDASKVSARVVSHDWRLLELARERASLESVFRQLTDDEK